MTTMDPMIASSDSLENAAACLGDSELPAVLRNGVKANAAQLKKAAQLLRDSDPSICNGIVAERLGWIDSVAQELGTGVLVFEIGILPSTTYRIDRKGDLVEESEYGACTRCGKQDWKGEFVELIGQSTSDNPDGGTGDPICPQCIEHDEDTTTKEIHA